MLIASAGNILAEDVPVVREKTWEIGGFVGSSYGLSSFRAMGGGNVTYAVRKYILPYFECSYFPSAGFAKTSQNVQGTGSINGQQVPFYARYTTSLNISDVHAGVHLRVPIFKESPLVPYGAFGIGGLLYSQKPITLTYVLADGTRYNFPVPSQPNSVGPDFTVNFGGGLRYYVKQNWGMRVEAKVYKTTGLFNDYFGKVEFGVFVQLGKGK